MTNMEDQAVDLLALAHEERARLRELIVVLPEEFEALADELDGAVPSADTDELPAEYLRSIAQDFRALRASLTPIPTVDEATHKRINDLFHQKLEAESPDHPWVKRWKAARREGGG